MATSPDLRWRLDADDPQGALFEDVERHVGRGEFRGMEFLHVRARTIINEVPKASLVPFRYTINAYRGCSHACTYCLSGDTPILLAGGSTLPMADLQVGDMVVGTQEAGRFRHFVATPVLDHWATSRPAFRVTLDDGSAIVSSGDHRFLTDHGWRHVAGSDFEPRRLHLTPESTLVGTGPPRNGDEWPIVGSTVTGQGARRVVSVEPFADEMPLFDITTGTGDFVPNGAISHNCFARPTHEYLGMDAGKDFERRIVVKVNAVERLRAELAPARWGGHHIAMGTNTDPYQRCEGKYRLTRGIVGALSEAANPFSLLTKSTLVLSDLDLLAEAARRTDVRVNLSIGTLDEDVWKATEPGTPHPLKRVEAVARLNDAGVASGVLVAPVLPGLSDRPEQLEAVVKACVEAGARSISPLLLHLRPGVREQYLGWLTDARPDLVGTYERLYPRAYAPRRTQQQLSRTVMEMVERHGGYATSPARSRAVRPVVPTLPRPGASARQLDLGI